MDARLSLLSSFGGKSVTKAIWDFFNSIRAKRLLVVWDYLATESVLWPVDAI